MFMEKQKKLSVSEEIEILKKQISRERVRVNRLVQVLRHNLPRENLDKVISFYGEDCTGDHKSWPYFYGNTLDDFLREIVDP